MHSESDYFKLARREEAAGREPSALLFYLSSFCASYNGLSLYPYQAAGKIRKIQATLGLSDRELYSMVRSYGPLSDAECRRLLIYTFRGSVSGIRSILAGNPDLNGGLAYETA